MRISTSPYTLIILFFFVSVLVQIKAATVARQRVTCISRRSKCFLRAMTCPVECPTVRPIDSKAKGCFLDCDSPKCETVCRNRKPNCNGLGAACFDPRFIGGDGIVFYFHGKSNEHFSLITDLNLQINARFIGLRPTGRSRDYTWIQALGIMFDSHTFTLEATRTAKWDDEVNHLQFSYDGKALVIPQGHLSEWKSPEKDLKVERTSNMSSVTVTLPEIAEISLNVVPVTEQDNKIHNYQIPSDDCFAHLEVQFRFFGISPEVEGVLGRTYRPDFKNPAKPGVAMPVVGGEDRYKTTSLLTSDCKSCVFSPAGVNARESSLVMDYGTLDCNRGITGGNGIVCKK